MPQLRYWHSVEVSAGSRPTLREKEVDVLVEDSVGLYQGKSKIINRQNGRLYLTSQRLIYIDNTSPKDMSLSIELTDVKSIDFTPKFLRSSSKITIFFKTLKASASKTQTTSRQTTWICPICSFSNDISTNLNYSNAQYIPACQTCGVKPDVEVIQTAIEASRSNETQRDQPKFPLKQIECSACTFLNHPSMRNCEICGSILPMNTINEMSSDTREVFDDRIKIETETEDGLHEVSTPFIKLSFHKGGDKTFYDRLGQTLEKLQWDKLVQRGQVNRNVFVEQEQEQDSPGSRGMGLHRLTQLEENRTRKNEEIINSSLDDLQTLLAKANEIRGLIDSFKRLETGDDASQAKIIPTINQVTQSILRDPSKEDQKRLYLQEISRQLSDFLITDKTLEQEGGIITLIDLYALYNRGRVGFSLISPEELYEACSYFDSLRLPLVLKKINKVLVVQDLKFTSNEALISDIERFIEIYGVEDLFKYKYCNILKASEYFNWSLTITEEILNIGLESGVLCVDQQITGRHFYLNEFMIKDEQYVAPKEGQDIEPIKEEAAKELKATAPHIDHLVQISVPVNVPFPETPIHKVEDPSIQQNSPKTLTELEGLIL